MQIVDFALSLHSKNMHDFGKCKLIGKCDIDAYDTMDAGKTSELEDTGQWVLSFYHLRLELSLFTYS